MSGYQMATAERVGRMNHFRRELLPDSLSFYRNELGQVGRPNRAGWCACRCPFHNSKSGKSFAVHVDGAFVCRSCGVSGGDVIAFIRLRDGLSFRDACQRFGCWEENGKRVSKPRPGALVPFLRMDFVIDGVGHHAEVRDEPTTELQWLRRFYTDAKDRLAELHDGNGEKSDGEEEVQWGILASSWELIQMELGYAR
jgi:hypothetical protein